MLSATTAHDAPTITTGYWNIRGLGAPLRMMAEYAGVEYHAKLFDSSTDEWASYKAELLNVNPFANLPCVKDGDRVVTQSNACLSYLGAKFGLLGDAEQQTLVEQCLCQVMDLRNDAVALFYGKQIAHPATDAKRYREKSLLLPYMHTCMLSIPHSKTQSPARSDRYRGAALRQAGGVACSLQHRISRG